MSNRPLIYAAAALGVILLVVAALYMAEPAKSLPSFFPGHQAGSGHHHYKHGVAALVVALGCFVLAWFRSGPRSEPGTDAPPSAPA